MPETGKTDRTPLTGRVPIDRTPPLVSNPANSAGGPAAVRSALKHLRESRGLLSGVRLMTKVNQFDGIDCPGCAWPDPVEKRSNLGEYCENGAKAIADEAMAATITDSFFAQHSVRDLAARSDLWLGKQGRIAKPMILQAGDLYYKPIEWETAFELVGKTLNALSTPDKAVFYTSGRTSNEAAFLYQLFVRMFGTNNLPDCANLCHESSGKGLAEVIGGGKGTVTLQDFDETELILIIGQNPGTNHPRMLSSLQKAKRRGARIIHINPMPEAGMTRFKHPQEVFGWIGKGTAIADLFVQLKINGDVALLKGIQKALLERDAERPGQVIDREFVTAKTEGFDAFSEDLRRADWEDLERGAGVSRSVMQTAAHMIGSAEKMIICWAMGLTQHENAIANVQACVNLALMKGAIGKPGAGLCPVRGHSNVQGDRTMGITPSPSVRFLDKLAAHFQFVPPRKRGLDTVEALHAMSEGNVHTLVCLGGNILSAAPDTDFTAQALQKCDLTVQISTKLNRSHLVTGKTALILPCLGRTEIDEQRFGVQSVSVENSMGVVHSSRGTLRPASPYLKSEPAIIAGLAKATLPADQKSNWDTFTGNYDRIRDTIENVLPGFGSYNRRFREKGGFYLPNAVREGHFPTPSGRAVFTVHGISQLDLHQGELVLMTIRSHDQYNTTIYGLDDRYRGVKGNRRVVFIHPEDLKESGLTVENPVDIVSRHGSTERRAERFTLVPFPIAKGCLATYFPEANVLVSIDHTAKVSNTPGYKSIIVRLEPSL